MLPSMPILMTPAKELNDDSSDTSDESPSPHNNIENGHGNKSITSREASDHILASNCSPVQSSTTLTNNQVGDKLLTPEKRSLPEPTSALKKKKKTQQNKKMLAALTPDSESGLESSAQNFAEAYFQKVRNHLDDEKWTLFVQELVEFEEKADKQPAKLYRRMEVLLQPHSELVNEFLAFLLPHQALEVDRFIPYLLLCKMKEFIRKLNILLMKRQCRQVMAALESLASQPNVTLADVKATILPLLKASPLLINHFLEMLPGERPPESLMTDFEQMDWNDDSGFETIVVPESSDSYGSESCICHCHVGQKEQHCVSCGIKYLHGRVYLQHGKVLRPAKVTFKGAKHMDLHKWEGDNRRSRRKFLPKTLLSPNSLENRLHADSEDDCGVKKSPRTPRLKATRTKGCKKSVIGSKEEEILEGIFPLAKSNNEIASIEKTEQLVLDCKTPDIETEEHELDDVVMENECNTEEDEEEDKCLHSENESSIEGEDVAKEVESGNDFSFEDEEVEYFESENAQNMKENFEESYKGELSTQSCPSRIHFDTSEEGNEEEELTDIPDYIYTTGTTSEEPHKENSMQSEKNGNDLEDFKDKSSEDKSLEACDNIRTSIESPHIKLEDNTVTSPSHELLLPFKEENDPVKVKEEQPDSTNKDWTREEDKILLQTFQRESGLEQAIETAGHQLPNRSKEEIQSRYDVVLKLLKEMIYDETNSNP